MKKRQLFLYALSLSVSAAAFGGVSVFADSDYSSQTITAKVTGIAGSSVDLQVGELNLPEKMLRLRRKSRMTTATLPLTPAAHPTAMLRPRRKSRMMLATLPQAPMAHPTAMLRPRRKSRMMLTTVWTSSPQATTL